MKNRNEQAHVCLTRLREGAFSAEDIEAELITIVAGISQEHEKGTMLDMFRGRSNRLRRMIVLGCNFFLQGTGQIVSARTASPSPPRSLIDSD